MRVLAALPSRQAHGVAGKGEKLMRAEVTRTAVRRAAAFFALVAVVALGVFASGARADNPRSVTLMTQNIYQGTELEHALTATNSFEFVQGVATDYDNVIATDWPERADALAAEIAQSQPALVGLQEVATWRTQFPYPAGPQIVSYNFLQILLDALAAHGMHYAPVITRVNFTAAGPGLFPFGLMGVSLTEQTAIIARTDLPTHELRLSNPQQGAYQRMSVLPTLNGPFPLGGGWLSVDAKVRGKTFRFITTHLDGFSPLVAAEQAQEILDGPAAIDLPIVVAGDFNSTTSDPAYSEMTGAGFTDEWVTANPADPGLTCCQVPPDSIVNPASQLYSRIDYLFARGPLNPLDLHLLGTTPAARTASGLWPSDHAGLAGTLEIGPQPGLTP
ncbi:MAG: endonuclease/exonuclease/phosphatase family protein [Verrucomicrobiota bacterium]